jgi:hypothetical protein
MNATALFRMLGIDAAQADAQIKQVVGFVQGTNDNTAAIASRLQAIDEKQHAHGLQTSDVRFLATEIMQNNRAIMAQLALAVDTLARVAGALETLTKEKEPT